MKALSIKNPWAWLIVNGYKDIENRSWPTQLRGKILIHVGKSIDWEGCVEAGRIVHPMPPPEIFEADLGGIIGEVEIVDCVTKSDSPWFSGPYGFVLANAKRLPFMPLRGQLGFFEVEK